MFSFRVYLSSWSGWQSLEEAQEGMCTQDNSQTLSPSPSGPQTEYLGIQGRSSLNLVPGKRETRVVALSVNNISEPLIPGMLFIQCKVE